MMSVLNPWLSVLFGALGGFVGSGVRVGVGILIPPKDCNIQGICGSEADLTLHRFPLATFVVNIIGTLILGAVARVSARQQWDPAVLVVVGGGFCGGLTTMSSYVRTVNVRVYASLDFNLFCMQVIDTLKLFSSNNSSTAIAYMLLTLAAVFLVGGIGWSLGGLAPEVDGASASGGKP